LRVPAVNPSVCKPLKAAPFLRVGACLLAQLELSRLIWSAISLLDLAKAQTRAPLPNAAIAPLSRRPLTQGAQSALQALIAGRGQFAALRANFLNFGAP
jgi:hypothetical protein